MLIVQALLLRHLGQQWHADVAGMDAQRTGQFDHLHDLGGSGALTQRRLDVCADSGRVQVRSGRVDGEGDQMLYLGWQVAFLSRDGA